MESFLGVDVESGNSTTVVFLKGLLTLSNVDAPFRGIVDAPCGLKKFFPCVNIPDKFLA